MFYMVKATINVQKRQLDKEMVAHPKQKSKHATSDH